MIRTFLIFAYITLVLLISGLARAADYAPVDQVEFDSQSSLLHVSGMFSNSCQHSPKPAVIAVADGSTAKDVLLGVEVKNTVGKMCLEVVDGRYDIVIDLRSLDLPAKENLVLKFANVAEGTSFEAITTRIDRPAHGLQGSVTSLSGQLVEVPTIGFNNEPMFVVVSKTGTAVEVQSLIDLSAYLNKQVRISGVSLSHVVAPELDASELDYMKNTTGPKLEKVFATEISLAPLQ